MITEFKTLVLPDGNFVAPVDIFEPGDLKALQDIYASWRILCCQTAALNARSINLPDALSECGFCYFFNCWRTGKPIPGAEHASFDAYEPNSGERIQIKGSSVEEDLTSFGPKSVWDRLFFVDFFKEGKWDYTFDVYPIDTATILNVKVNKHETFLDQQRQRLRPRLSIVKSIIRPLGLKPQFTCDLSNGTATKYY